MINKILSICLLLGTGCHREWDNKSCMDYVRKQFKTEQMDPMARAYFEVDISNFCFYNNNDGYKVLKILRGEADE